jgi:hypothetical protein
MSVQSLEDFEGSAVDWLEVCFSDTESDVERDVIVDSASEGSASEDEDDSAFELKAEKPGIQNAVNLPHLKALAASLQPQSDPVEIFNLLLNGELLTEILRCTNLKLETLRSQREDRPKDLYDLDVVELRAFLGLLLFSGAFKGSWEDFREFFAKDGTGRDIFRATMNVNRFAVLLSALRFDDGTQRNMGDPTAQIGNIFQTFVEGCQSVYSPGDNLCVDEMLVGFRGRCGFKMRSPNKPERCGLKILCLTDASNNYLFNAYIYSGDISLEDQRLPKHSRSVLRLSKPLWGSKRTITADSCFGSIELAQILKVKGLTFVGAIRKAPREAPLESIPQNTEHDGSDVCGFSEDLTSAVPKQSTVLISTLHHTREEGRTTQKKILKYYNSTKSGVATLEEKCRRYGTARRTRRWPMAIFFRILDIAIINAYTLYGLYENSKPMKRINFMKSVARSLVEPQMRKRLTIRQVHQRTKEIIKEILQIPKGMYLLILF